VTVKTSGATGKAALAAFAVVVLGFAGYVLQHRPPIPVARLVSPATLSVAPAPPQPAALFVGDSYTLGTGASGARQAESCLTADALGWSCNLDAEDGTGFINNGHSFDLTASALLGRLKDTKARYYADIILVDAGRSDARFASEQVQRAETIYLTALRAAWPKATLVLIAPYYMSSFAPLFGSSYLHYLQVQAKRFSAAVLDPIGEGWISEATAGMTTLDRVDPDAAGHRYIAQHLVADLRRLGLGQVPLTDPRRRTS
jgi:hypothetical protein